jgi:hypothetical protein
MKCPKCGYHSFDHLISCKKCSHDLAEHMAKFNLRGFFFPGKTIAAAPVAVFDENNVEEEQSDDGTVDFGFDFLDEEEEPVKAAPKSIPLDKSGRAINIDEPFAADGETVPAGTPGKKNDPDDKPRKGPEFAF